MLGIILDELRLNPPAASFGPGATLPLLFQFGSLFIVSQMKVPHMAFVFSRSCDVAGFLPIESV